MTTKGTARTRAKANPDQDSSSIEKVLGSEFNESLLEGLPQELLWKLKEFRLKNDVLNASCLISMTDKKGFITYVNDKFCELAKYTREELIGKNHNIVRHPDMPKAVFKEIWGTIGKGNMFNGFIKNKAKDGTHYWVEAFIAPILGADGKPEAYIGIRYDITELMEASDQGEALSQAIDLGWASIEFLPDGTILGANDNFVSAMGYAKESDVEGKHHSIFCDPEYAKSSEYKKFWPSLAKGEVIAGEFQRISKSGDTVFIQASYTPVKDKNGKVVKVIKIAADVTEMVRMREEAKQAMEELAAQEEELRQNMEEMQATQEFVERQKRTTEETLNQALDSIIAINQEKEITFYNKAAERMFGYKPEEVMGQNVKMLVPMHHQAGHDGYVDNNINTGENKVVGKGRELEMNDKNGRKFWGHLSLSKVETEDGLQFTAFIRDITNERADRIKAQAIQSAVDTGWASIEFEPDGTIITANDNFVAGLGYGDVSELVGQHHKMFCEDKLVNSSEYKQFWNNIANGEVQSGEFKRIKKDGSEVWINASYTPIKDAQGNVFKAIKIATDITAMMASRVQADAVKTAVDTGWASIEFHPDGTIISANDNFVAGLGYSSNSEIAGNHHRIFCDPAYAASADYANFWKDLANGKVFSGEFRRIKKDGNDIWINASYTPVKDEEGNVFKVIKIATDITAQKNVITQIQEVVRVASEEGNLTARVSMDNAEGDYKILSESINELMNTISEPVGAIKELIISLSEGDLTNRFDKEVQGEFKEMGDAYNSAVDNVGTLMANIQELANLVASSSEEMNAKGEQMKGSTQEMAAAIQQMAEGVQDQAQQIDQANKLIDNVLGTAKDMAQKSGTINKTAEEGQSNASQGVETINRVVENMDEIQKSADVTSQSIQVLTERSEEIARTLNVITDIASQTNLLALNAAIEAARAGEAGRGFAVVAEEIRKLAEDSRKSAADIEKVITEVQKDVGSASKSIEGMEVSVKNGSKASGEAEEVFQKINEFSGQTVELSKEILEATSNQEVAIDGTVKNIEKIVVVSEETASGTEQIASSSHELNQGMDEVSATSKDLADVANQLLEGVAKFKLTK